MKTAVLVKPVSSSVPAKNVGGQERRRAAVSPVKCPTPSGDLLQPPKFESKQTLKRPTGDIYRRGNLLLGAGKNVSPPAGQSSVREQDGLAEDTVTGSAAADVKTTDSTCTPADLNLADNAGESDVQGDVKRSPLDLLPISSAAVYDAVSNARDSLARSSDSISSILSAAERSRAAKLAFLGFTLAEDDQPVVMNASEVRDQADGFTLPPAARCDDSSALSCSSSGLGSSLSGSPVVSPDDNVDDQTSSQSKHSAVCGAHVPQSGQQVFPNGSVQPTYQRTVQLTDRSKQTSV